MKESRSGFSFPFLQCQSLFGSFSVTGAVLLVLAGLGEIGQEGSVSTAFSAKELSFVERGLPGAGADFLIPHGTLQ